MTRQILTVFGGTGKQGGSVLRAVLSHPALKDKWTIRAVSRDASKPSSQQLAALDNVEVVTANLDNQKQVLAAVQGSSAVFGVTDFWQSMKKDVEVSQGKALVDAAIEARVKHFIFSSLPHATRLSSGQLPHIEHFDGKAEVQEYAESVKSKSDLVTTYVQAAYFMSNLDSAIHPDPQTQELVFDAPFGDGDKTEFPLIDIEQDYGKYVAAVLAADPAKVNGLAVHAVSLWSSPNAIAKTVSQYLSQPVKYIDMDAQEFAKRIPNEVVASELSENMILIRDFSYYGKDAKAKQAQFDAFLPPNTEKTSLEDYLKLRSKWKQN